MVTAGEGKIPGTEYLAFGDDGSGRRNVTLMVQEALTARETAPLGQLLVELKSPGLAPVKATLLMLSGAVPTLDNVTLCGALNVPTF